MTVGTDFAMSMAMPDEYVMLNLFVGISFENLQMTLSTHK